MDRKRAIAPVVSVVLIGLFWLGCTEGSNPPPHSSDTDSGSSNCDPATDASKTAVMFDIDGTLTTSDAEFATQIVNPKHDPAMRPDANKLAQGYAALGYKVMYVTARGSGLSLSDGTSATDATNAWLAGHGFPQLKNTVFLASGIGLTGTAATSYKTDVMNTLKKQGYVLSYAYGNSTTDIDAYRNVNIANDHIFLVGSASDQASSYGVEPLPDKDAYTNHYASFMPSVPCAK